MSASRILLLGLINLIAVRTHAQTDLPPQRVGPDVHAPKLIHKADPEYSTEASRAGVQGTVLYRIVVDEHGIPGNIEVLSPIGYGLDEKGEAAIAKWRFEPGTKDGKPVKVIATVEVNFRIQQRNFDEKAEHRRTVFNAALANLRGTSDPQIQRALKDLKALADQDFPPAMGVLGGFLLFGQHLPKDPVAGFALIQKSADKDYGPAMFQVGLAYIKGDPLPSDPERGMKLIRNAAALGSSQAQFYLASKYETGDSVPLDLDRARRYYRLCAASGLDLCQFHLGRLLRDKDPVQALAWLNLAKAQGNKNAAALVQEQIASLSPDQIKRSEKLQTQLLRKP